MDTKTPPTSLIEQVRDQIAYGLAYPDFHAPKVVELGSDIDLYITEVEAYRHTMELIMGEVRKLYNQIALQPEANTAGTGVKYDSGKPRMDLLSPEWLLEVARVLTFGADKYGPHNWRGGIAYSRLIGAALRHISAINQGEDHDPESKLLHAAHASCCMMMLTAFQLSGDNSLDDRYKPQA